MNSVVALQLAPRMSWPDAMGMVVLAGFVVMLLVATGLRERVMNAVPYGLRKAIAIGIGLFIMLIGLVDSGFVSRIPDAAQTTVPLQLGADGHLNGWPVLVFVLGALLTLALIVRKVPGAILISIVVMTVVAVAINAVADVPSWGLTSPEWPGNPVATPDFGLIGQVSLFGGFSKVGVLTGVLFVFTVLLSCFFDAMGTIMGVSDEAKLTDGEGQMPGINKVLFIDGVAVAAGGASSASATTAFVESTAACRRGRAHRLRQRRHRRSVRRGAVPHAGRHHGPVPGGHPGAARGGLPDPGQRDPGDRLGGPHHRDPGLRHDGDDAVHLLDHQRHRDGLPHLRGAAPRGGRGKEVPAALYVVAAVFAFYYLMPALGLT